MSKHGKGRRRRPYIGARIDHSFALGTLAGNTLIGSLVSDSVTETAWASSIRCTYALDQFTPGTDDGPITVGVAHGDYSDAEVESWLEIQGNWDQGKLVEQEIGRRKCRIIGTFDGPRDALDAVRLNEGRPITTKLGWQLSTGQSLRFWAYNNGISTLATTDPTVHVLGKANLWPN